mmetsp:Transcript_6164/g.18175  ORF Transcript_6164/g.18175 Transcript_6164/m.18175 type:complete len:257 (+) Transcript_6164:636-1406(+)
MVRRGPSGLPRTRDALRAAGSARSERRRRGAAGLRRCDHRRARRCQLRRRGRKVRDLRRPSTARVGSHLWRHRVLRRRVRRRRRPVSHAHREARHCHRSRWRRGRRRRSSGPPRHRVEVCVERPRRCRRRGGSGGRSRVVEQVDQVWGRRRVLAGRVGDGGEDRRRRRAGPGGRGRRGRLGRLGQAAPSPGRGGWLGGVGVVEKGMRRRLERAVRLERGRGLAGVEPHLHELRDLAVSLRLRLARLLLLQDVVAKG